MDSFVCMIVSDLVKHPSWTESVKTKNIFFILFVSVWEYHGILCCSFYIFYFLHFSAAFEWCFKDLSIMSVIHTEMKTMFLAVAPNTSTQEELLEIVRYPSVWYSSFVFYSQSSSIWTYSDLFCPTSGGHIRQTALIRSLRGVLVADLSPHAEQ